MNSSQSQTDMLNFCLKSVSLPNFVSTQNTNSFMIIPTKQFFWISCIILGLGGVSITTNSCAKRKKNKNTANMTKPMRPDGNLYSAYDPEFRWALEMELEGSFSFIDFVNNIEIQCETGSFQAIQSGNKQGLKWTMMTPDSFEIHFTIFDHNCYNFGFNNKPFELEMSNENGVLYRIGGCGCYHQEFGFNEKYVLQTINGQDFKTLTKLTEAPELSFQKIKTNNLIEGRLACRSWRSVINLLERRIFLNYDLAPNMECIESAELSEFMESIGNKPLHFSFSANNNTLTLSNKNDTFVFTKLK
jgi:hypothetical protein